MALRALALAAALWLDACSRPVPVPGAPQDERAGKTADAAAADTALRRAAGVYLSDGMTTERGRVSDPFEVRATVAGNQLRLVIAADLWPAVGRVYLLRPYPPAAFEYEADDGRVVRFELQGADGARLVLQGPGRGGVVTFQLVRSAG